MRKQANVILMSKHDFEAFYDCCHDILNHPVFLKQKTFIHHDQITVYEHVVIVAYYAYLVAKKVSLKPHDLVCGALLHDFFLYDWHIEGKVRRKKLFQKHGFTHAKLAAQNAEIYFAISSVQKDIIKKHMFPLNLSAPLFVESWLVNIIDSYVTFKEYFDQSNQLRKQLIKYIEDHQK